MLSFRRKLQLTASFGVLILMAAVGVGCNGFFVDPILQTITVGPSGIGILVGGTQQMSAIGTYDDGSQKNISGKVIWGTSDQTIASVTTAGLVKGVGVGDATISATSVTVSGSGTINVTNPVTSITVTPSSQAVSASGGIPFCLTAIASPGSTDISSLSSTTWTFTANGTAVTGIAKTSNTGCAVAGTQAFAISTLVPGPPVTVSATASASGTNGTTVTSPTVSISITP